MSKSPLLASSAYRWIMCAGSVALEAARPPLDEGVNEGREEGKACHELAVKIIQSHQGGLSILTSNDVIDTFSDNGVLITRDLFDASYEYAISVLEYCNRNGLLQSIMLETKVDLSHIYPEMYGYIDCWCYDPKTNTLTVWDAKFGRTIVEVFECWQLIQYASGLIRQLGFNGLTEQVVKIDLIIVQPRAYHKDGPVRTWSIMATDLRGYVNILVSKAVEAKSDSADCVVGDHCNGCLAAHRCETLQRNTYTSVDYISQGCDTTLIGDNLGYELKLLRQAKQRLKDRLAGIEAQVMCEIKAGKSVGNFAVEQGYGRERWKKSTPVDEIIYMGELLEQDISSTVINCTPKQAIAKGIDEAVIRQYSETPLGELKLIEQDNAKARQVFKKQN